MDVSQLFVEGMEAVGLKATATMVSRSIPRFVGQYAARYPPIFPLIHGLDYSTGRVQHY